MQADYIRPDADGHTVDRHLEAFLLWLFGWTMFCGSQGDAVSKFLLPYAREIADAEPGCVPQYSWGSAVLAETYRGLCLACVKTRGIPVLLGCPLLLQLWCHERFPIGRPLVDAGPYREAGQDEVDRPTFGTLWCLRKVYSSNCMSICYILALRR